MPASVHHSMDSWFESHSRPVCHPHSDHREPASTALRLWGPRRFPVPESVERGPAHQRREQGVRHRPRHRQRHCGHSSQQLPCEPRRPRGHRFPSVARGLHGAHGGFGSLPKRAGASLWCLPVAPHPTLSTLSTLPRPLARKTGRSMHASGRATGRCAPA